MSAHEIALKAAARKANEKRAETYGKSERGRWHLFTRSKTRARIEAEAERVGVSPSRIVDETLETIWGTSE